MNPDTEKRIDAWVADHRAEFTTALAELVSVRSVSSDPEPGRPFGPGPAAALDAALALCRRYGLDTANDDYYVGTADLLPELPRALDILAHLDTVAEGDGWTSDPLTLLRREDGCLYGRGVADDKGGALAALWAMRCVKGLALPLRAGCRLILGTDEEVGMRDILHYYAHESSAPHTLTPDASFPVCNVEKGQFRFSFRKQWESETALPRALRAQGGIRINMIPTEASAVIAGLTERELSMALVPLCAELGVCFRTETLEDGVRLTVTGRGCHASLPEDGVNGLTALVRLVCELPLAECDSTGALRELDRLLPHGDAAGRALGIALSDEQSGALTCAFTLLELDANGLSGSCDCRVPVSADRDNCFRPAVDALAAVGFETDSAVNAAHCVPADSSFVQTLLRCYERVTGLGGYCFPMGGGTYVHHIPGGVAFGIQPPDFDTHMHGADERLPERALEDAVRIYALTIAALCGGEEGDCQ